MLQNSVQKDHKCRNSYKTFNSIRKSKGPYDKVFIQKKGAD